LENICGMGGEGCIPGKRNKDFYNTDINELKNG
jgi:hypothetical protein